MENSILFSSTHDILFLQFEIWIEVVTRKDLIIL